MNTDNIAVTEQEEEAFEVMSKDQEKLEAGLCVLLCDLDTYEKMSNNLKAKCVIAWLEEKGVLQ